MASLLPPIGTTYPSLNHFKLDMLERAEEHRSNLRIRGGAKDGTSITLGCPLRVDGKPCELKIRAVELDHGVKIDKASGPHSCDGEERESQHDRAEESIRTRINNLRLEITMTARPSRRKRLITVSNAWSDTPGDRLESSSFSDSSDLTDIEDLEVGRSNAPAQFKRLSDEAQSGHLHSPVQHCPAQNLRKPSSTHPRQAHQSLGTCSRVDEARSVAKREELDLILDCAGDQRSHAVAASKQTEALLPSSFTSSIVTALSLPATTPSHSSKSERSADSLNCIRPRRSEVVHAATPITTRKRKCTGFAPSRSGSPVIEPLPVASSARIFVAPTPQLVSPPILADHAPMLPPPLRRCKIDLVPNIQQSTSPSSTPSLFSRMWTALQYLRPRRNNRTEPYPVEIPSPPSPPIATCEPQDHLQSTIPESQDRILDWSIPPRQVTYSSWQYASFLRRFGVTDPELTIASLKLAEIDSLETLVLVGSMEKVVIDALAVEMGQENGELIRQVGEGIRSCLNGDES